MTASRYAWLTDAISVDRLRTMENDLADLAAAGGSVPRWHRGLLSARSKRLRPAVVFLASRFGPSADETVLVSAAVGIEALHEGTLYHDDIVDRESIRRGEASAYAGSGARAAAFAGSELLYATAELFSTLPAPLRRSVGRAGQRLCRGQLREVERLGSLEVTPRERIRVMRDKTASLFELAARLGAGIAGADFEIVTSLRRYGRYLGLAFQLADDLADMTAPRDVGQRRPGADLRDGVYSLPVLYGLQSTCVAGNRLRALLLRLRSQASEQLIDEARALAVEAGGVGRAIRRLDTWAEEARGALDRVQHAGTKEPGSAGASPSRFDGSDDQPAGWSESGAEAVRSLRRLIEHVCASARGSTSPDAEPTGLRALAAAACAAAGDRMHA